MSANFRCQLSSHQNCSSRGEGCRFVPNGEIPAHRCALLPAPPGRAPSALLPRMALICPRSCQRPKEMAPNEKRFQSCLAGNYYTLLSNLRLAGLPGEMLLCWKTWKKLRSGGWLLLLFRAEESGVEPITVPVLSGPM